MSNKDFPKFGVAQVGLYLRSLTNYYLPNFILALVAKECDSELVEKGKTPRRLQSMNENALELLYRIFVERQEDEKGRYDRYRFLTYVSSIYHKCDILINEKISGLSGRSYKIPIAVRSNGMYIAVAFNKGKGNAVTKQETEKFYNIVDDLKQGNNGVQLADAIYCSSVGFKDDALAGLEKLTRARSDEPVTKIDLKTANFENGMYNTLLNTKTCKPLKVRDNNK